jgi:hypothetical protein
MRPRILLILLILAAPAPAYAQIEECGFFKRTIDDIVAGRIPPRRTTTPQTAQR